MRRFFQSRFFKRKWVVPVAALVLTLSVGSIAFAATGSTTMDASTSGVVSTATTVTVRATTDATLDLSGGAVDQGSAVLSSDQLAVAQAKENAILDLIREKMTSADQATFDQLRAAATEEQAALQQAQTDLSDTTAKIDLLVDTYLGISTSSTSTSTSDSTSGSGSTTFGSIM